MKTEYDRIMQGQKDDAERYRLEKEMVYRVCHAICGTCVMKLVNSSRYLGECTTENCTTMRAAFAEEI